MHKGLGVKLITGKPGGLTEQVEAGELDSALVVERLGRLSANFAWHPPYAEPLVAVAGRHMCNRVEEVSHTHLFPCFDCVVCTGALIDRALRKVHMVVSESIEVNSIGAIVKLVHQQVGVTLASCLCRTSQESDPALCTLPMPPQTPVCVVGMVKWKEHMWYDVIQVALDALETTLGRSNA